MRLCAPKKSRFFAKFHAHPSQPRAKTVARKTPRTSFEAWAATIFATTPSGTRHRNSGWPAVTFPPSDARSFQRCPQLPETQSSNPREKAGQNNPTQQTFTTAPVTNKGVLLRSPGYHVCGTILFVARDVSYMHPSGETGTSLHALMPPPTLVSARWWRRSGGTNCVKLCAHTCVSESPQGSPERSNKCKKMAARTNWL
eukprot:gene12621-biopygen16948